MPVVGDACVTQIEAAAARNASRFDVFAGSAAVLLIVSLTLGAARQTSFSAGINTVAVYVTVVGEGGTLTSALSASDFEVRDDGELQSITQFQSGMLPITMAVLLDDSPSAQSVKSLTRAAATALIERMKPADRLALGVFNRSVRMHGGLTNDKSELLRQLSLSEPLVSGTAMWDALHAGMATVADEGSRRVVLILSDGDDNSSEADPSRVARDALNDGVMIYGIGVRGSARRLSSSLKELALGTGGWFFELKNHDNLAATFNRVADELRAQYLLGFSPRVLDGKQHRVEVRLKKRGLTARARTRYLAAPVTSGAPSGH